jgi:hypothetical protein
MINTANKTEKDDATRANTDIDAREIERPQRPAPEDDNDPERVGGDLEARESRRPAPPSPSDNDPERSV